MKKESIKEFVILFFWNLWHSEVLWSTLKRKMLESGEVMRWLMSVRVPIYFSMHACDVSWLAVAYPEIVKAIKANPFIRVPLSTYSHVMPSVFPDIMEVQLAYGRKVLAHHFGEEKLAPEIGFLSDFNIYDNLVPTLVEQGWRGAIHLQGLNNLYQMNMTGIGKIFTPFTGRHNVIKHFHRDFPLYLSAGAKLRNAYLGYFRDFGDKLSVRQAFKQEVREQEDISRCSRVTKSNSGLGIFLTDFEPPWINETGGRPRIELFTELMEEFRMDNHFIHLSDSENISAIEIPDNMSVKERILHPKWHHSQREYFQIVDALRILSPSPRSTFYQLMLTGSDFASAFFWEEVKNFQPVLLPINKSDQKVRIYGDVENRRQAMNYLIGRMNGEKSPNLSEEAKWFLKIMEKAITLDMEILNR